MANPKKQSIPTEENVDLLNSEDKVSETPSTLVAPSPDQSYTPGSEDGSKLSPNPAGSGFTSQKIVDSLPLSGEVNKLYIVPIKNAGSAIIGYKKWAWDLETRSWRRVYGSLPSLQVKDGGREQKAIVTNPNRDKPKVFNEPVTFNGKVYIGGHLVTGEDKEGTHVVGNPTSDGQPHPTLIRLQIDQNQFDIPVPRDTLVINKTVANNAFTVTSEDFTSASTVDDCLLVLTISGSKYPVCKSSSSANEVRFESGLYVAKFLKDGSTYSGTVEQVQEKANVYEAEDITTLDYEILDIIKCGDVIKVGSDTYYATYVNFDNQRYEFVKITLPTLTVYLYEPDVETGDTVYSGSTTYTIPTSSGIKLYRHRLGMQYNGDNQGVIFTYSSDKTYCFIDVISTSPTPITHNDLMFNSDSIFNSDSFVAIKFYVQYDFIPYFSSSGNGNVGKIFGLYKCSTTNTWTLFNSTAAPLVDNVTEL